MDCCDSQDTSSILPQRYDFLPRLAGDTWQGLKFSIVINDEPEDLTDCLVEIGFRKTALGKLEWLLSSETGAITIDENEITVEPRLLTLSPGSYVYDLQITYPDGFVRTYLTGSFKVLKDITPSS